VKFNIKFTFNFVSLQNGLCTPYCQIFPTWDRIRLTIHQTGKLWWRTPIELGSNQGIEFMPLLNSQGY